MSLGRGGEETHRGVTLISGRAPDTAAADTGLSPCLCSG